MSGFASSYTCVHPAPIQKRCPACRSYAAIVELMEAQYIQRNTTRDLLLKQVLSGSIEGLKTALWILRKRFPAKHFYDTAYKLKGRSK